MRDEENRKDFEPILEAYKYRGCANGVRGIHMRLLHEPGIIVNPKKIRRLMRKNNLFCPIRKANPYRRMDIADPVKACETYDKVKARADDCTTTTAASGSCAS